MATTHPHRHNYPQSHVFYRDLTRTFPRITDGRGVYLFDADGKRYLDACGGAYVANLGHGVAAIAASIGAQAARIAYVNGTAFTTGPAEELAAEMAALAPPGLDKVYFLSSGSEAVEAALKLARQYWVESGRPTKHKIIACTPGYHGNTLLALSASARNHYRRLYEPWLTDVIMIPASYAYRCGCRGDADCPSCSGSTLEDALLAAGPENVAAFIVEPVGGSSTGASVPRPGYHRRVREICDRYDVLFIADEVLTGAGRTGRWLAMEHAGVVPDIVTMGKGISGGYAPLSAVLAGARLLDVIARGSGSLKHAQTFSHNPIGCAAGLAAVRYIAENGLVERAARVGLILHERLRGLLRLPAVGDVRGLGMLAGIELVRDKETRAPWPRALKLAEKVVQRAQDLGLVLWPNVGQVNGADGDIVMVAPPFVITEAEIDELVTLLGAAVEQASSACEAAAGPPQRLTSNDTMPGGIP